ncbi:SagB family peptide dehydrogenase [Vitiosangium sp. GDMCC 1.1324]|uniref:SagB/ThcOx family dehydrogenase n=1 Tax=Vitiosangium sp. (strain GDMCC 1.1324) TaxID=2138576 RepID=UPI00130EAE24|nr:SagB family peptide dehydrogenase [Vitiosangium sp. GDMCC 1.1324]
MLRLFFGTGVSVVELAEQQLAIRGAGWQFVLRQASRGLGHAVRALAGAGATRAELADQLLEHDGPAALARLYYHLDEWRSSGVLGAVAVGASGALATLAPLPVPDASGPLQTGEPAPDIAYVLSPFACLRRVDDELMVESSTTGARILVHDPRARLLCMTLISAHTRDALPHAACGLSSEEADALCALLHHARILVQAHPTAHSQDAHDEPLARWQFHDLLFHTRSRMGRHVGGYGGTFRGAAPVQPAPALKAPMSATAVDLYRPAIDRLCADDTPFTRVLEARRSRREYGATPITEQELGAFLYRVARVRTTAADRPYPSGGASYELELYLSVASCGRLAAGLYHYHAGEHRLHFLSPMTPDVRALLEDAARALGRQDPPHVLITIAARFPRVFWKYESMGYALILQNVGALYQTMYLVATAMGLAPCALGGGNPDVFARASGLGRLTEASVGEFALGSSPRHGPAGE